MPVQEKIVYPNNWYQNGVAWKKGRHLELLHPGSVAPDFILKLLVCFIVVSRLRWRLFTWRNDDTKVWKVFLGLVRSSLKDSFVGV